MAAVGGSPGVLKPHDAELGEARESDGREKPDVTQTRVPIAGCGSLNVGYLSLLVLVVQNSVLVLMTRWSRSRADIPIYRTSTMVLVAELTKMAGCLVCTAVEFANEGKGEGGDEAGRRSASQVLSRLVSCMFSVETVKLIVPAALFTFQNYLLFVSLSNLDAMTFQVLSQVKLLLAAIFSIILLGRFLTCMQWTSVFLLMGGIAIASTPSGSASGGGRGAGAVQSNMLGVVACVASGLSSSFASVYFEKILKGTPPSIAVRNVQLGVSAIVFALISCIVVDGMPFLQFEFFRGYTPITWVLVLVHAGGGVLVAVVVKYADNILKGFATGIAIVVSGGFAAVAWGYAPSAHFVAGSAVVCAGTVLYNVPCEHPLARRIARGMPGGSRIPPTPLTPPGPTATAALLGSLNRLPADTVGRRADGARQGTKAQSPAQQAIGLTSAGRK
eukprot:TRINITY_DN43558_c0_g1_i1.p1 TRINITY_DN43558_c0_g1~~TRINITY_DN43558_c0_g1_i1.p1  ORF type:complete len:462 (+),score=95.74 TRINITY_DN43558_c0_g1_i1:53-1387(+)